MRTARRIALAALLAGTLDIAAAMLLAVTGGRTIVSMLTGIATGPFPAARQWSPAAGAAAGLLVHFAIITAMAAVYILLAKRGSRLGRNWLAGGAGYGIATWAVMNLVVLPLRWPAAFPNLDPATVATQLACHILLVGLPIALVAARR